MRQNVVAPACWSLLLAQRAHSVYRMSTLREVLVEARSERPISRRLHRKNIGTIAGEHSTSLRRGRATSELGRSII